jgi:hypothetical protein
MPYEFLTPTAHEQPMAPEGQRSPLWSRVRIPVGYTVVKTTAGGYRQEREHNPDRADIAVVYHGGHRHIVSDDEAASLIAAGYGPYLNAVSP